MFQRSLSCVPTTKPAVFTNPQRKQRAVPRRTLPRTSVSAVDIAWYSQTELATMTVAHHFVHMHAPCLFLYRYVVGWSWLNAARMTLLLSAIQCVIES